MVYYLKGDIDCILSLEKKTIESLLTSLGEDVDLNSLGRKQLDEYSDYVAQKDSVAGALVYKYSALRHYVRSLTEYGRFEVFDGGYVKDEQAIMIKRQ